MDRFVFDNIYDGNRIKAYLKDLYYLNKPLVNSMINAYDLGIPFDIISGGFSNQLILGYKKRLVSEYGISDEIAYCSIDEWIGLLSDNFISGFWYCVKDGCITQLDSEDVALLLLINGCYPDDACFIVLDRFDNDVKTSIYKIIEESGLMANSVFCHKYGLNHHVRYSKSVFENRYKNISYAPQFGHNNEIEKQIHNCENNIKDFVKKVYHNSSMICDLEVRYILYPIIVEKINKYLFDKVPINYKENPQNHYRSDGDYYIFNEKYKISDSIFIDHISIDCEKFDADISLSRIKYLCSFDEEKQHFKDELFNLMISKLSLENINSWRELCKRDFEQEDVEDILIDVWRWEYAFRSLYSESDEQQFYDHEYDNFEEILKLAFIGIIDEIEIRINKRFVKYKCNRLDLRKVAPWIAEDVCEYLSSNDIYIPELLSMVINNYDFLKFLIDKDIINLDLLKKKKKKIRDMIDNNIVYKESLEKAFENKIVFFKSDSELSEDILFVKELINHKFSNEFVDKRLKRILAFYYDVYN